MYSLMSMRTMARSSSNRKSASVRASSVLPTPVGPRNRNEPIGWWGSDRPGPGPTNRVRDRGHRVVLADHPLVQLVLHADELLHLALHEARHRDAGPLRHDLGDVLLVDLFLQHRVTALELVEAIGANLDLRVEIAHRAVAKLGGALEVAVALGLLGVGARGLERLLALADRADRVLLELPLRDHGVALLVEARPARLRARPAAASRRRRSPWPARPSRSRADGSGARRRRARSASSRSRSAGATRTRRPGRSPCPAADATGCTGRSSTAAATSAASWMRTPWWTS